MSMYYVRITGVFPLDFGKVAFVGLSRGLAAETNTAERFALGSVS